MTPVTLDSILDGPPGAWLRVEGPEADIVYSSRVRLARNIEGMPFPHAMSAEQAGEISEQMRAAVEALNADGRFGTYGMFPLSGMGALERQVLVEKHLISPYHARVSRYGAVVVRGDEVVSMLVNEEDHLRVQCMYPGLQLEGAWRLADRIDDVVEGKIRYAFDDRRGYLTACPTNAGTGLRASAMLHLPALIVTGEAERVLNAIGKLGLAARGVYGEGTSAAGGIFQVSNQITLGQSEEDIISNLRAVASRMIQEERMALDRLLRDDRKRLEDRVWRAYGLLTNARILSSGEAAKHLSDVRLGVALGLIEGVDPVRLNELMIQTRPGCLQRLAGRELDAFERDVHRADLVRRRLGRDR